MFILLTFQMPFGNYCGYTKATPVQLSAPRLPATCDVVLKMKEKQILMIKYNLAHFK